jgi:hypothetical protein
MADCRYRCLGRGGCEDLTDCCHSCLYFAGEECVGPAGNHYFPRRFVRYLNQ